MYKNVLRLLSCRITKYMRQNLDIEVIYRDTSLVRATDVIVKLLYDEYIKVDDKTAFLESINNKYLKFMVRKSRAVAPSNYKLPHTVRVPVSTHAIYYEMRGSLPYHLRHRTLEIACFYYFNMLPDELKKTYY